MLKSLTGQSTRQHIHNYLIEKAKEKLSATDLSVREIAYELNFEHPQSFSKLFQGENGSFTAGILGEVYLMNGYATVSPVN